jgi:hypothetical protein
MTVTERYIPPCRQPKPKHVHEIIIHNDKEYKLIDKDKIESYPESYDLVHLLIEEPEVRVIPGWHVGNKTFGGYRFNDTMKVMAWKITTGMY